MSDLVHFDFGMNTVRTLLRDGEIWFVGKDVAEVLGYARSADAIRMHCKGVDEMETPSAGGMQKMKIIPERDLYRLIFRSRLPEAERFEDWVVSEVLPALRKNGTYTIEQEKESPELDYTQLSDDVLHLKPHIRSHVLRCALHAAKMDGNTPERIDYYFTKYASIVGARSRAFYKSPTQRSAEIFSLVEEWLEKEMLEPAPRRSREFQIQSTHLYNRFKRWCIKFEKKDIPGHHYWAREARKVLPYRKSNYYFYYVKEQIVERAA